ncbi:MAG: tRNA (N6-isopentenyl adenosine(37)-C2)-methylthiotransferase MiaB [Crocinitomicaceae bacterium]|nr:tRNA (N6-isopentenyl adenosine(37)-C2)-methylthiotransferase MiaB [Crocinitomicaceae bacterium]
MNWENKEIDESVQGTATMIEGETDGLKKLYLESYGCQMNFSDSEIVASILTKSGFSTTRNPLDADVILLNTCSIRENAEQRVRNKLSQFNTIKKNNPALVIGILGCMAERLKTELLEQEKLVDLVAGPDAYRDLPNLIDTADSGQKAVNVLLSREETYADISPVRLGKNGVNAFISIMRGCDNMCSFCVVPFTRGRERSRDPESILNEAKELFEKGFREVTLLGQNVDSYRWNITKKNEVIEPSKPTVSFAQLLEKIALVNPLLRVRFSTSHPKDMTDDVLHVIAKYHNICKYIHLPVQSGNTDVLARMNRGYSREWYLERIKAIRTILPEASISSDIITGFCGETEEEHQDTVSLMKICNFDYSYMFSYSERPKTLAERKFKDDVPEDVKKRRLNEVQTLQHDLAFKNNSAAIGKTFEVLVEGISKRSSDEVYGRNSQNLTVIFPKENFKPGDYAMVKITESTSATVRGIAVNNN